MSVVPTLGQDSPPFPPTARRRETSLTENARRRPGESSIAKSSARASLGVANWLGLWRFGQFAERSES